MKRIIFVSNIAMLIFLLASCNQDPSVPSSASPTTQVVSQIDTTNSTGKTSPSSSGILSINTTTTESGESTTTDTTVSTTGSEQTLLNSNPYQKYSGTWYDDVANADVLTVSIVDNNTLNLEMNIYRLTNIYAIAKIENNEIKFLGNTSEDNNGVVINGMIKFEEDSISVVFDQSKFDYIANGSIYNFYIKE